MLKLVATVLGLVCGVQVSTMSLTGPVLTRYVPCSLGVVYFDKVTDILWKGTFNLGLYPNLTKAQIGINFQRPITLYGVSQNTQLNISKESNNFTLTPLGKLPARYHIYFTLNGSAEDRPTVTKFALNNLDMCNENSTDHSNETSIIFDNGIHVCGRQSVSHAEYMSVRTDSKAGDWPWHVAVLVKGPPTSTKSQAFYQCGGNIISHTAVLTAGHCIFINDLQIETKRLIVIAGVSNLRDIRETGRQELAAEKVVVHPSYSKEHGTSDLAMIIVRKLQFTEYVQPICIWGPRYDKTSLLNKQAVVTGFGLTERDQFSDTLRSSNTIVQADATCIAYAPQLYTNLLNEFTLCAGEGPNSGTNPRTGDSGGGLVYPLMDTDNKISWYLRGVLSKCGVPAGEKLCDPKYYVVYTDVAPHYAWIFHHMQQ